MTSWYPVIPLFAVACCAAALLRLERQLVQEVEQLRCMVTALADSRSGLDRLEASRATAPGRRAASPNP